MRHAKIQSRQFKPKRGPAANMREAAADHAQHTRDGGDGGADHGGWHVKATAAPSAANAAPSEAIAGPLSQASPFSAAPSAFTPIDISGIDTEAPPLDLAFSAPNAPDLPPIYLGFEKMGGRLAVDLMGRWAGLVQCKSIVLELSAPDLEERLLELCGALENQHVFIWRVKPFFAAMAEFMEACGGRVKALHLWSTFRHVSTYWSALGFDIGGPGTMRGPNALGVDGFGPVPNPDSLDASAVEAIYREAMGLASEPDFPSRAVWVALMAGHGMDAILAKHRGTLPTTSAMADVHRHWLGLPARQEAAEIESFLGPIAGSHDGGADAGGRRSRSL